jgi:hypothetical protein
MSTTITALPGGQPANADVLPFDNAAGSLTSKATKAQILTAATAESIGLAGLLSSSITISSAGVITATAGTPAAGAGLGINLTATAAVAASGGAGGSITLTPGLNDGAGAVGTVVFQNPDGVGGHSGSLSFSNSTGLIVAANGSTLPVVISSGSVTIVAFASSNGQKKGQLTTTAFQLISGSQVAWNSSATDIVGGSIDTAFVRVAAGVAGLATSPATWFQSTAGRARNTADRTNATVTMSNLTDLTMNLLAGRKYIGRIVLIANNSAGTEGLAFDFNGGSATMTNFQATAEETPIGATLGVTNATALGTAITSTVVATTDTIYAINITLVCNAAGTFIPRFAEVSHTSGTATVRLGSYMMLEDSPN